MIGALSSFRRIMIAFTVFCIAIIAPIVVITAFFALELFAGLKPSRSRAMLKANPRTAIVIPAHDEEAVIGRTIADLLEAGGHSLLLVVADNCNDQTAALAKQAGATVLTRNDPERRGKGFALAAARDALRMDPPDVVVVLDADCRLDGRCLRSLSAAAALSQRACQAVNLLAPDLSAPAVVQISNFAFMIKNLTRQRGLQRLARRAHLTGTGMALPWSVFADADLGGSNIVEDLALGLDLADRALPPRLIEDATVWSPPASAKGTLVQRRRWEGGYIATSLKRAPGALFRSVATLDLRGFVAALDLSVPPLALLFVLNALAFLLGVVIAVVDGPRWPVITQTAAAIAAAAGLTIAWICEGRRFVSGTTLLSLPIYVLWKLPIYLGFIRTGSPKEWLRSGR